MFNFFISLSIYLNRVLSFLGLKLIRNKKPLFLNLSKDKDLHPAVAFCRGFNQDILLRVPVRFGRTSRWFDLSKDSLDPSLVALNSALKNKIHGDELHIFLMQLFEARRDLVSPLTAIAAAGLSENKESELSNYPAWSLVLPWDVEDIEHKFHSYPASVKKNRLNNGFRIDSKDPIRIMEQDRLNSIDSHVKQFTKLLDSIDKNGLLQGKKYGYISAIILIDGDDWRWIIGGEGNHRTVVAASIGYKELDVVVEKVVRKEDSKWWPNVYNGLYTITQAEKVFDDIFNANPSFVYDQWMHYAIDKIKSPSSRT
jgi:hypothetical protein